MSTSTLKPPLKIIVKPDVTTDRVGGVDIPSVETAKDVFVTIFEGKAGFLNLTRGALKRKVDGQGIIVPPFSMRFVKFAGNNQSIKRV